MGSDILRKIACKAVLGSDILRKIACEAALGSDILRKIACEAVLSSIPAVHHTDNNVQSELIFRLFRFNKKGR